MSGVIKSIITRIDTSANWKTLNPIPKNGEQCIEDLGSGLFKLKIGDGVTPWIALKYHDDVFIGNLEDLKTPVKDSIVGAINSLQEQMETVGTPVELTLEEYLQLGEEKFSDNVTYLITDWDGAEPIYVFGLDCGKTGEDPIGAAIDCKYTDIAYDRQISDSLI